MIPFYEIYGIPNRSALSKSSELWLRGDRPNFYTEIGSSFLAQITKSPFLKVGVISLLGGVRGRHDKEMAGSCANSCLNEVFYALGRQRDKCRRVSLLQRFG